MHNKTARRSRRRGDTTLDGTAENGAREVLPAGFGAAAAFTGARLGVRVLPWAPGAQNQRASVPDARNDGRPSHGAASLPGFAGVLGRRPVAARPLQEKP